MSSQHSERAAVCATIDPSNHNNTTQTSKSHIFRVASNAVITKPQGAPDAGAVAVTAGQLRIALSWPDIPSGAGSGGPPRRGLPMPGRPRPLPTPVGPNHSPAS